MKKTHIEWCDYSINPVKGLCPMACKDNRGKEYCYARRMYKRFKWNMRQRYDASAWLGLGSLRKPSRIFVGSMYELFGNWVNLRSLELIFEVVREFPQHTFLFLTKKPENLAEWSPFPENCWVGVSVTSNGGMTLAMTNLANIRAPMRFISFEPLLGAIGMNDHMSMKGIIDWVIIGQCTPVKASTEPKIEWVHEIVEAADKADIPVFLKDNLIPLFDENHDGVFLYPEWAMNKVGFALRQELPRGG